MKNLARAGLSLAFLLLVLSAWLRLSRAGTACADWPMCYGRVWPLDATTAELFPAWSKLVTVGLTGLLAVCAALLLLQSLRLGRHRWLAILLLALSAGLTWFGYAHHEAWHPAATVGTSLAHFFLLGAWSWLLFRVQPGAPQYTESRIRHVRPAVLTALVLLSLQLLIGAVTSASFAGRACPDFPTCNEAWTPDATLYSALRVDRGYQVSPAGYVVGSHERQAVQLAHRWLGALTALAVLAVGIAAFPSFLRLQRLGIAATGTVAATFLVGMGLALTDLGSYLAPLHPALSGILLMLLLKIHALSRERWWHDYSNVRNEASVDWDNVPDSRLSS